jgi:hypothetical protein
MMNFLSSVSFAQSNFPLFDSAWYGFNTGKYPSGQSPSAVKLQTWIMMEILTCNFAGKFFQWICGFKESGQRQYSIPVKYNSAKASLDIVVADFNNDSKKRCGAY